MYLYKKGSVVPEFFGHQEETRIEIDDSGATMLVFFNDPTEKEIAQFESGKTFEIRYITINGVIVFTVKIGDLNWMDAPYTPHLSKNLTMMQIPKDKQGLALTLMLINGRNGKIENIRMIGLSNDFTKNLIGDIMEEKSKEFDAYTYYAKVGQLFARYSTKEIVKMSKYYSKTY